MDRLDEITVFLAILDEGGISAAARKLGRSAAAVTRSLAGLEHALGVRLIERTTRRMAPTDAGRRLADHGRTFLAEFENGMREVSGHATALRGRLCVTAPLVFGRLHVAPTVLSFLQAHPAIDVELRLSDRNLDMLDEGIDAAVRIGRLADSSLVVRRLGEVRPILVASASYLAQHGTPERPQDLPQHRIIHFHSRPSVNEWRFAGPKGEDVIRFSPRLEISQAETALDAAMAGQGIVNCLSYQAERALADGRLVRILQPFEPAALPVHFVIQSARYVLPRLRAFMDHAVRELSALPALRPQPGR